MSVVLGALGVAAAWGVGFAAAPLLTHLNGPQRTGFAYGVGLVWISTMMGIEALIGVPLTPAVGMAGVVGPMAGWWLWRAWSERRGPAGPGVGFRRLDVVRDPLWWGAVILLATLWVMVTIRAVVKPLPFGDAWTTYAFKAKVIFSEGDIPSPTLFGWSGNPNYPDYPLGVSLQEVWVTWFVGTWDDVAVKWLFSGYLLALLCLAYGALCERWGRRPAALGTLFVAGLPLVLQHGQDGYTDLPLAYFVLGGAAALTRYVLSGARQDLWLASVFGAGLVWTRVDGVILVACNALLLSVRALRGSTLIAPKAWRDVSIYLALPAIIWSAWTLVKLHFGIASSFNANWSSVVPLADRWSTIANALFRAFFLEGNWLILWALVALGVIHRYRELVTLESMFLFWPVVGYLGSVAVLFATTGLFRFLEDDTVLHRLILHVAPLAALWVAHVFGRWWGWERTDGGLQSTLGVSRGSGESRGGRGRLAAS